MKETFVPRSFAAKSLLIIEQANEIVETYSAQGFMLTLRQLYYQFVSRDLIPNRQSEYKRLGSIINDARLAGLLDWSAIEDRTRNVRTISAWGSPNAIVQAVASQYKEDLWKGQSYVPEVWIEKDALVGVIEPTCKEWRVPFFACRGYASQSEVYSAGKRFKEILLSGRTPVVLHLGDHDPSGIDMTRDNEGRLAMFARQGVQVRRLALNMDQINRYSPPPNPAKDTDARFSNYRQEYGNQSWELDALEPSVIADLIATEIQTLINSGDWQQRVEQEAENRDLLAKVSARWSEVVGILSSHGP